MAAPIAEGAPEGCTPASGRGRGDRTADDGGLVEAGVDAVVSAGVDAEVDARTSMTTATVVARLGRARPAVPLEPQAEPVTPKIVLPTLTALLGRAGPAMPAESTMCLTTLLVAEVDARASLAMTTMMARLGRASPAVPRESRALSTSTARLGGATPAVPVESQALLMRRQSVPPTPGTMVPMDTKSLLDNV